jgi:hypothetical protein
LMAMFGQFEKTELSGLLYRNIQFW